MEHTVIPVESIRERDIDLILLEEFWTDNAFCEWFIKELNLPTLISVNGAWRSISEFGLGETDLLFSYNSIDRKIFVLIENKLDTSFQPDQYIRYCTRAEEYLNTNECDSTHVVLIAPQLYCENQNDFETWVTYESIAQQFEKSGTKRNLFKSRLLKIAIEKLRRGYQPVNSVPVQDFWKSYWAYKEEKFPDFTMKKPDIVPYGSDWPMLFDEKLKDIVFYHKLQQGVADATFKGFSEEVEFRIKENLPVWATYHKHRSSFSIRIYTPTIDRTTDFAGQVEQVHKGLENLQRIRNWILQNRNLFQE